MRALTRLEADIAFAQGCSNPECKDKFCDDEMYIHQNCHPEAPTQTKYSKKEGVITVECMLCEKMIAAFQIADS